MMASMKEGKNDDDHDDDNKKPHAHTINADGTKKKKEKKEKKRKKKNENQNQKRPPTCNVIAPETMAGGTKFETNIDGIKFIVKVPDSGVTKGSTLTVPYPSSSKSSSSTTTESNNNSNNNSKMTSASASAIQFPSVQATLVIPEELPTTASAASYPTKSFTHTNASSNSNSNTTAAAAAADATTIRVMAPDTLYAGSIFEVQVNMNTFMVTVPYGGVTKGDMFDVPYPTYFTNTPVPTDTDTVQVMAPSTMNGGQMFEAQVDGITFMVTVPKNGINQGELFTVPYPTTTTTIGGELLPSLSTGPTTANNNNNNVANAYDIPTTDGTWRTTFCDWCPGGNCCLCLMGFLCTPIVMAQSMQRMKYNFAGVPVQPNGTGHKNVCMVISITSILLFIPVSILSNFIPYIGFFLLYGWILYLVSIFTFTRYSMRKEYNIKPLCCNDGGGFEDFCLVYWCSCCSAIQMIAHTHDGKKYPYNPCNQTGLDMYAPDIHIV